MDGSGCVPRTPCCVLAAHVACDSGVRTSLDRAPVAAQFVLVAFECYSDGPSRQTSRIKCGDKVPRRPGT